MKSNSTPIIISAILLATTAIIGAYASSSLASADTDVIDSVQLTVPIACTMTGTGTTHAATMNPGTYSGASGSEYENGIGKTTLTAICNDDNGFSIYAVGYTGNSLDSANHTKLVGNNTSGLIDTAVYSNNDTTSSWSMKLTKVTNPGSSDPVTYNPQNLTITTGYDTWHTVPSSYTKVAEYKANTGSSTTDTTLGVKLETTYAAYVASNQSADVYEGQVKYTMVHPYNEAPLQPQSTESGCIRYYPNGSNVEGTMGCQEVSSSATSITLLASNFSRTGYGFAGWSNKYDYATNPDQEGIKFYGPQEDITFTAGQYTGTNPGLSLYAVWVKSQGSLQDEAKVTQLCGTSPTTGTLKIAPTNGTANLSSVSALTDERDNETYAIARLADGNCWMIENLRLEAEATRGGANKALAQGYGESTTYGNFSGLANAESTNFSNSTTANSLYYSGTQSGDATVDIGTTDYPGYRMPRYNNLNTPANANNRPDHPTSNTFANDGTTVGMYSYGNYYTWHAAIADTTRYSSGDHDTTSLCPKGWKLPRGGDKSREATNDFWSLIVTGINGGTNPANYDSTTTPNYIGTPEGSDASNKLRAYPNNFLYSGYFTTSSAYHRKSNGYYWSSTVYNNYYSYTLRLYSTDVGPGTNNYSKYLGYSIRCMVSPSV